MNHRDRRRDAPEEADTVGWLTLLIVVLAAPLTACAGIILLLQTIEIGPGVGDIVTFDTNTTTENLSQLRVTAGYAPAVWPNEQATRSCVLNPSVMLANGGSLVIEAREMTRPPFYRVHWSGKRTDQGTGDCGSSADLTVPLKELRVLANAAGGFGVAQKRSAF